MPHRQRAKGELGITAGDIKRYITEGNGLWFCLSLWLDVESTSAPSIFSALASHSHEGSGRNENGNPPFWDDFGANTSAQRLDGAFHTKYGNFHSRRISWFCQCCSSRSWEFYNTVKVMSAQKNLLRVYEKRCVSSKCLFFGNVARRSLKNENKANSEIERAENHLWGLG